MKRLINVSVMLLACSFYTASNCYYPIAAHTALKVYLDNNTPYKVSLGYQEKDMPLDKKAWEKGDDIKPFSDEELIFWKKGKIAKDKIHTIVITSTVKSSPEYKFVFSVQYVGGDLLFGFPTSQKPIKAIDFKRDKIPVYILGQVKGKNLVLSVNKSQSYGMGVNRYGVIVFDLDLK